MEHDTTVQGGPDLATYDVILVNSSAGKDSQAMLTHVVELCDAQGIERRRVIVVHCDLGRVEWQGTKALAKTQAEFYGLRFEVVSRPQGDLLDHVEARGMWPSSAARYCTSDHKRGQVEVLMTKLAKEHSDLGRPVRILNCMGLRAEESPARAKRVAFSHNNRASSGKKWVDEWLPVHEWKLGKVWETIRRSQVPHHYAYDLGMPRLSCCFCIFSPDAGLLLAGYHNRELLAEYTRVERKIGHTFRVKTTLVQIEEKLAAGFVPGRVMDTDWMQCA